MKTLITRLDAFQSLHLGVNVRSQFNFVGFFFSSANMLSVSFFSDRTSPRTFSFILDLNYSSSKYPENHNLTTLSCLVDEHFALLPISLLEYWYESSNELVNKKKKKGGAKNCGGKKKDPYLTRLGHRNWKWYLMPETDANSFDFQLTRRRKEKKNGCCSD